MSENKPIILLDGGVGRELKRRGVEVPPTIWTAKALLSDPETVREVHADFIKAGADVITANNYAVVPKLLATEGLKDRLAEFTRLAGRLANHARDVAGRDVLISGVPPPLARTYRADLVGTTREIFPIYRDIADALAANVDIMLCETMSSSVEARVVAQAAAQTGKRIWASWTLDDETSGRLRSGESVSQALAALDGLAVEAILFNCTQPESISIALPELRRNTNKLVGGYANAFRPVPENWERDPTWYTDLRTDLDPERYAAFVSGWLDEGSDIVGGCFGIGPEHIARIRELLA